jgi:hypothetical protein
MAEFSELFQEVPSKQGTLLSKEEAIAVVCSFCSLAIASRIQMRSGMKVKETFIGKINTEEVMGLAKSAADTLYKLEKVGADLSYDFDPNHWKELISVSGEEETRQFCSSQLSRLELLWRCVLE